MGIFSKFSNGSPSREHWGSIALNIAKGLEDVRTMWFNSCVQTLKEKSPEQDDDSVEIEAVNNRLGGNADLAIKAYQLFLTSSSIGQHNYIKSSEGKDFADILYAQVCGINLEECLSFFSRYHKANDGGTQLFRFSSDVAKYITGKEAPLSESMLIASTVPKFMAINHIVVARSFGDDKTVHKINSKLGVIVKNIKSFENRKNREYQCLVEKRN